MLTVFEYHGITSAPTEQGKSLLHGSSSVSFGLFSYQVLNKLKVLLTAEVRTLRVFQALMLWCFYLLNFAVLFPCCCSALILDFVFQPGKASLVVVSCGFSTVLALRNQRKRTVIQTQRICHSRWIALEARHVWWRGQGGNTCKWK